MEAKEYNQKQIKDAKIRGDHVTALTKLWQLDHRLTVDGRCGPKTLKSIINEGTDEAPESPTPEAEPLVTTNEYYSEDGHEEESEPDVDTSPLKLQLPNVLFVAKTEIGKGEDPTIGNNRGSDVDRYREGDGTEIGPGGKGSWCGVFVSFCFMQASGGNLSFKTSRGAKKLGRNIAKAGRECDLPEPGAVIVWDRGLLSWQGHIGLCYQYDQATDTLTTIEGNKNSRGQRFAKVEYFTYPDGLWRRKLDRIAIDY